MNINFAKLDFSILGKISKFSIRIIILIAIILYYLNYRNNQCIINQNCQPFFFSYAIKPFKKFESIYALYFKIDNTANDINFYIDHEFYKQNYLKNFIDEQADYLEKARNHITSNSPVLIYNQLYIINTNNMVIKRFKIENKSSELRKVKAQISTQPTSKSNLKIYNCFCNSTIVLEPFETKDVYMYMNISDSNLDNYYSLVTIKIMN